MPPISIQGEVDGRRFVVFLGFERYRLQPSSFEYLLELVIARLSKIGGHLRHTESVTAGGDPEYCRILAHRLKQELGKKVVETGMKSYRLSMTRDEIRIGPALYELKGVINPQIIGRLEVIMNSVERK